MTYRPKVSSILRNYYQQPKDVDVQLQKIRFIEAAAAIIKSDVKESIPSKWMEIERNGENWGWYVRDRMFYPKTMDSKCAPDKLLQIVHCKCKTDCSSKRCSCRRNGLHCTYVCGSCQTDGCCNVGTVVETVENDL